MSTIQPFDIRSGQIWFNGNFIEWTDAKIHILTHGLHYASCVFEGIRSYDYNIFKLEEHHERLHRSANILGFTIPYSADELNVAARNLIQKNEISSGYIRTFAWRGSEQISVSAPHTRIHVAMAAWETPRNYFNTQSAQDKGARLALSKWARPMPNTAPLKSKCAANYAVSTIAKHEAIDQGFDDALLLDYRGYVAEASAANIFFVADRTLYTPTTHCALAGITRSTVLEIAQSLGIRVVECEIPLEKLAEFNEGFLTGTACEILPITSIDHHAYQCGELTNLIIQKYQECLYSKKAGG